MKNALFLLILLHSVNIFAQDVIVKKDGSTVICKVTEIGLSEIKYKKFSNLNGPVYILKTSEIMVVNYENGDKETFVNNDTNKEKTEPFTDNAFIDIPADSRNSELISYYNKYYKPTKEVGLSNKTAKRILVIVGMKSSSIISNKDVELNFVSNKLKGPYYDYWCYGLEIVNKTNNTIYIDKGNCFRISSESPLFCYFDTSEQTTVSEGGGSGLAVGIGNISLSGGRALSVSKTYSQQRIIAIPSKSSRYLTEDKWIEVNKTLQTNEKEFIESMERFQFKHVKSDIIGIKQGDIKIGQTLTFKEEELPWDRKYVITYSTEESFRTYSSLTAEFYIQEIIGCKRLMSPMKYRPTLDGLMEDELKFDTYVHNYNKYTIIGYHQFEE